MARLNKEQRLNMAKQAFNYDAREGMISGLARKKEPSCYGKLIKFIMSQRGFTFKTFSEQLGISPQTLNHRLNGQKSNNFRLEDLKKYCKMLRFDEDDFFAVSELLKGMENERN